jgi:tetratricopeptide (TPR) repeat protein
MINADDDFKLDANHAPTERQRRLIFAAASLAVFIFLLYANSLRDSWHFDDEGNIFPNKNIQMTELSWPQLSKSFHGASERRINRPAAYLSFALNYYFGGLNVFGYHLVNIFIHISASIFLFLFIREMLHLPLLRGRYGRHAHSIALLSAFLWASSPIQVSSVTYIVQRMTSMSAMFYIMAMFFYLKGRISDAIGKKIFYIALTIAAGLLSIGAKENALMLPFSLYLMDIILIQGADRATVGKNIRYAVLPLLLFIGLVVLCVDLSSMLDGYRFRPFSMAERLLTEPRVILFYISLLIYPATSRFTFLYDIDISKGLFEPATTLPAIIAVAVIVAAAFAMARRRPLISYCLIFFFLNHAIEGSFLPLEIIYEHRNYLPSMLLFVPIAVLVRDALLRFSGRKLLFATTAIAVASILVLQGVGVLTRNAIFENEFTLWADNAEKYPHLNRPHHNLGIAYYRMGFYPEAFLELKKALAAKTTTAAIEKKITHLCLAKLYLMWDNDEKAIAHLGQSMRLDPSYSEAYQVMAEIMIKKKRYDDAEKMIRRAICLRKGDDDFHLTYGKILIKKGEPERAVKQARIALLLNGEAKEAYGVISDAFKLKGNAEAARHFRELAEEKKR